MYWVKQLIKEARGNGESMDSLLAEFRSSFGYEPRLILLELVYQLVYTRTDISEQELEQVRRIAVILQISVYDQQSMENKYRYGRQYGNGTGPQAAGASDARHYAVLGLEPGASFEEAKKAYRKLSMQYHPDKVRHLGEEFRKVAEEKMKEINVAYDYLEKKLNGNHG
jgi:DnaJ like chaperone protein